MKPEQLREIAEATALKVARQIIDDPEDTTIDYEEMFPVPFEKEFNEAFAIELFAEFQKHKDARIAEFEAYNAGRTDEMLAATKRVAELEAAIAGAKP